MHRRQLANTCEHVSEFEGLSEKAVRAGATRLVTVSLPTSMAVTRAERAGLSLWCLARDDSVLLVNDGVN